MNTCLLEALVQPGRHAALPSLDFNLPPALEAGQPPELRGLRRDQVRMLVSHRRSQALEHSRFDRLPQFLQPGDVLVINTSKTLKAALNAWREDGQQLEVHLSTRLPDGRWMLELRRLTADGTRSFHEAAVGERLKLPGGGSLVLGTPYPNGSQPSRLWNGRLSLPLAFNEYLEKFGFPIRYKYVHQGWPVEYYQTVYASEPGSAEMPSAGRAFTPELMAKLAASGIRFAPLVLHTGVASLGDDELPYPEAYRVSESTARLVNQGRAERKRVIAVGTTAVRALQTVTKANGQVVAGEGWTDIVIAPGDEIKSIDGLLTGLHEPSSTHLSMLLAIAGDQVVRQAYQAALKTGYLWHEFGDLHLILP